MGIVTTLAQSGYYYDDSSYYTTSNANAEAALAVGFGIMMFALIFSVAMYVVFALCLMRIFKKAGIEQQWAAWVPIYNNWKLLEIGGQQGFWAVLALVPIVNIVSVVFMYISMYNVGLKLGKEGVFVLLAIFLSPVWLIWLAVDGSTWDESKGAPSLTPVKTTASNTPADAPTGTPPVPPKPTV
jgi:hypothetical protein